MEKEYLIHERPMKALLIFSLPMMIGNLFQQFYTMADSIVVGRFVSEYLFLSLSEAELALRSLFHRHLGQEITRKCALLSIRHLSLFSP